MDTGYGKLDRKESGSTNLINGEKFKKFIEKLCNKYGYNDLLVMVSALIDDFMNMSEEEINNYYF